MTDLRPRGNRPGRARTLARHGRLRRRHPFGFLAKLAAAVLGVALVSGTSIAAIAALEVAGSTHPAVPLVDAHGKTVTPSLGAMQGAFNVLLAGSDSGGGNAEYGERGENLNDVTMLLHVSADHKNATVISFPRDMLVPIPSCPDPKGGSTDAMSSQKINTTLSYGGLACTVLTVQKLTGLDIPYAAMIEFDGVIAMSNAVGGVPVCLAGRIDDDYVNPPLHLDAGNYTIKGAEALSYLRTRHGIGDGSDLGRISNQQSFMSSLVRTIVSGKTLWDPGKVYGIARAAASNMTLSQSLSSVTTMASMAVAMKGIDPKSVVFVQYPNHYVEGGSGVAPSEDDAAQLISAIKSDTPITLTGTTGVGSEPAAGAAAPPASSAPLPASAAPSTNPSSAAPTAAATPGAGVLSKDVHGQTAAEQTCAKPYQD